MNQSRFGESRPEGIGEVFAKSSLVIILAVAIDIINGSFVYTYFKSSGFYQDSRYVLFIHLLINDMILVTTTVFSFILGYVTYGEIQTAFCCSILILTSVTDRNTPLNLAAMGLERYVAVCHPLHHSQFCKVQRIHILIATMWLLSAIPSCCDLVFAVLAKPLSYFSGVVVCHLNGVFDTEAHDLKDIIVQATLTALVLPTLIITYLRVVLAAMLSSAADKASAIKARNTILLHGAQLCPSLLSYLCTILSQYLLSLYRYQTLNILYTSFVLLTLLPRMLTSLIYGLRDQNLCRELKKYLVCSAAKRVKPMSQPKTSSKNGRKT